MSEEKLQDAIAAALANAKKELQLDNAQNFVTALNDNDDDDIVEVEAGAKGKGSSGNA